MDDLQSNVYDGQGGGSHGWDDNGTWFDRHVSTDRMRQLESDLSEARRQLAALRDVDDALRASYMLDVSDLESQPKQSNDALSAAQKKLWNAESEVVLLRAERNAAREQLAEARKIVWLLIELVRARNANASNPGIASTAMWYAHAYGALPRWLRKEIER